MQALNKPKDENKPLVNFLRELWDHVVTETKPMKKREMASLLQQLSIEVRREVSDPLVREVSRTKLNGLANALLSDYVDGEELTGFLCRFLRGKPSFKVEIGGASLDILA